jgi:hypothetical protein
VDSDHGVAEIWSEWAGEETARMFPTSKSSMKSVDSYYTNGVTTIATFACAHSKPQHLNFHIWEMPVEIALP